LCIYKFNVCIICINRADECVAGGHSHADAPDKGTMMALITVVGVLGFLVAVLLILVVLLHTRRYCDAIDAVAKSDILRRYEMQSEGHPQGTPHPRDSAPGGMIELGSSKSIHAVLAAFGRPHGLSARHRSGHRHGHKRSRSMGHMSPVPEGCEDPSPAGSPLKLPEVGESPEEEQDPKQAGEEVTEKAHGDHQWQLRQLAGKAGLGRQKNAQRVTKYSPLASQSGSGEYALACVEAMSTSDPDIDVPIAVTTEGYPLPSHSRSLTFLSCMQSNFTAAWLTDIVYLYMTMCRKLR
jgi:hypothetical protein